MLIYDPIWKIKASQKALYVLDLGKMILFYHWVIKKAQYIDMSKLYG